MGVKFVVVAVAGDGAKAPLVDGAACAALVLAAATGAGGVDALTTGAVVFETVAPAFAVFFLATVHLRRFDFGFLRSFAVHVGSGFFFVAFFLAWCFAAGFFFACVVVAISLPIGGEADWYSLSGANWADLAS